MPLELPSRTRANPSTRGAHTLQIADEREHQALAYASAGTADGHSLTVNEFNAYMSKPPHSSVFAIAGLAAGILGETETVLGRRDRRMWLASNGGIVTLTSLGSAVLWALDKDQIGSAVPLEVVLSPEDSNSRLSGIEVSSQR